MSDADNQTGGAGDPNFESPDNTRHTPPQPPAQTPGDQDENDNAIMTDDDLPSGG